MEYEIYTVHEEEKLSSIAHKYNTTPEAIKALNPHMRTFGGFIAGEFISTTCTGAKRRIKNLGRYHLVIDYP